MSYLLRVVLPDRPGALGFVATALGKVDIDIAGISIVERGTGGAVDDLLIVLPPNGLADAVFTAVHSVPGAIVESLRPYPMGVPGARDDLELVDILSDRPEQAPAVLADLTPGLFYADWAVLLEHADGRLHTRVASVGAPDLHANGFAATGRVPLAIPWLPLRKARSLAAMDDGSFPARWRELGMELAAAPVGRDNLVILLGRPGGPRFRPSEVARLAHLADITAALIRSVSST